MGNVNNVMLQKLLYGMDDSDVVKTLTNIDDSVLLHHFAANYNWDNGFSIPMGILENEMCDLGTGLLLFYHADGYSMLDSFADMLGSTVDDQHVFLNVAYFKIVNLQFNQQSISFTPELTKIQRYKLKKKHPNLPDVIINESPGLVLDVPVV